MPMGGRSANMDRFFDLYAGWLKREGKEHSPDLFRHWATREYCPDGCRCTIKPLDVPDHLHCGKPAAVRVRACNTSQETWRLKQDYCAGVHLYFAILDDRNHAVHIGRAGLFEAEVAPDTSIDLTFALPAVHKPGIYRLVVDMIDEQQCVTFSQVGSEPLEQELAFCE